MTDQLTPEEIKQVSTLLAKLEPGYLPIEIFWQVARLVVLSIVEFVPLRLSADGKVEVLLLAREGNDPHWANNIHTPGVVIRPTDKEPELRQPFKRIIADELAGLAVSDPHLVTARLHESERGMENSLIFWVEVQGEPTVGTFYPVDNLPENIVATQPDFIKLATEDFLRYKQK